jgi:hypothetical protein
MSLMGGKTQPQKPAAQVAPSPGSSDMSIVVVPNGAPTAMTMQSDDDAAAAAAVAAAHAADEADAVRPFDDQTPLLPASPAGAEPPEPPPVLTDLTEPPVLTEEERQRAAAAEKLQLNSLMAAAGAYTPPLFRSI